MAASERERVGCYRIGAVSSATGISTHTLRVWERRYDVLSLSRTEGGVRLYSEADVARLRRLKQLLERGFAIGQIARLPDEELERLLAQGGLPIPPEAPAQDAEAFPALRFRFLEAVRVFDLPEAERILLGAVGGIEPRRLVLELLPPLFEEVGLRWARGEFHVAHEHAASALLRNTLGALLRTSQSTPGAPTVVSTTLSGELHEFGALLTALLATALGWNTAYLGPNLPAEEILLAVNRSKARAVLLSLVYVENSAAARRFADELAKLKTGLPPGVELLAGGAAAPQLKDSLRGMKVMQELAALEAWLTTQRRKSR